MQKLRLAQYTRYMVIPLLKWYKHLTVIQKFLIYLTTNKGMIYLIVGSGNFGPAVAGPVPLPCYVFTKESYEFLKCQI